MGDSGANGRFRDRADEVGTVAKTRTQLNRRLPDAAKLPWPPFGKAWYAGCTTLIIGNSLKAGISKPLPSHLALKLLISPQGFVAFDQYKALLQDAEGKISGPRTVIAGFGAGVTESLLAVTPFESIKTTLYVVPCPQFYHRANSRPVGLTTARAPTLECAVSSTLSLSSPANVVSEGFSKVSCQRPLDKQPIVQYALDLTLSFVNWHNRTPHQEKNSVLCQLSELEE